MRGNHLAYAATQVVTYPYPNTALKQVFSASEREKKRIILSEYPEKKHHALNLTHSFHDQHHALNLTHSFHDQRHALNLTHSFHDQRHALDLTHSFRVCC